MKELILPFPPRVLNPNNRVHWSLRAKDAKAYKSDCFYLAKQAGWFGVEFTPRVHLWIDFYPPDKRAYDDDNIAAAFKAGRDGIAEALGINDRRFVSHPMLHAFSKEFQGVKVRISESPE
jgi:crossover junction endodeoxyribonuclease RusA